MCSVKFALCSDQCAVCSVQCSAVQCSAMQCSTMQCSAVQCSAVQCSAVKCSDGVVAKMQFRRLQRGTAAGESSLTQPPEAVQQPAKYSRLLIVLQSAICSATV